MCTAAGPDPNPIGGGQLPTNPNECNWGYLPLPLYIDVDERGHCLRLGSPLTFFPRATTSGSRTSMIKEEGEGIKICTCPGSRYTNSSHY